NNGRNFFMFFFLFINGLTVVISGGDGTLPFTTEIIDFAFREAHSYFRPLDCMVVRPFYGDDLTQILLGRWRCFYAFDCNCFFQFLTDLPLLFGL
ncbi:hypothetical protein C2E25_10295, partial [Geothermobacter hydrogeniphilus]